MILPKPQWLIGSVRNKLLAMALLPLLVVFPLLVLAIAIWSSITYDRLLITKVRSDLSVARGYFDQTLIEIGSGTRGVARSQKIREAMNNGKLAEQLANDRAELGLDFLVLYRHNDPENPLPLALGPMLEPFAQPLSETGAAQIVRWDQSIAVNARHAFFAAQAVLPGMIAAGKGSIINLGSISWMIKQGGMPVYTTAKAAIQGLTRSLARDLGPHGIRVNTLVPGWVMTEKQLRLWVTEAGLRRLDENQCLPGHLEAADIARMALFLAADDSAMCTGQEFIVDGGWA